MYVIILFKKIYIFRIDVCQTVASLFYKVTANKMSQF